MELFRRASGLALIRLPQQNYDSLEAFLIHWPQVSPLSG